MPKTKRVLILLPTSISHRGGIRRCCCPEGTQSCGGSVLLHTQSGQSDKHFRVLKILSCPLLCPCVEKHTIRSQHFALVGSNKAEQISNIYVISSGKTSRQSQKHQCQIKYHCQARIGKQTFQLLVPVLQRHKSVSSLCS